MFRKTLMASALILASAASAASADTMFTVANTFEDPKITGGVETSIATLSHGKKINEAATVSDDVEIANFINYYKIDVAADMSSLTMTLTDTATPSNNPITAKRFDRYYFTFTGAGPAEATIDVNASTASLAQGATVTVITAGRLVVAFGEGADYTPGNKLVVNFK